MIQKISMDFTYCLSLAAAVVVEDAQQNVMERGEVISKHTLDFSYLWTLLITWVLP